MKFQVFWTIKAIMGLVYPSFDITKTPLIEVLEKIVKKKNIFQLLFFLEFHILIVLKGKISFFFYPSSESFHPFCSLDNSSLELKVRNIYHLNNSLLSGAKRSHLPFHDKFLFHGIKSQSILKTLISF